MSQFEMNNDNDPETITVIVLGNGESRLGMKVGYDTALTLWATMSEDPRTWDEVASYWPRYSCPEVCEFLSGLPLRRCSREEAQAAIEDHGLWLAIDLDQKRVVTGSEIENIGRRVTLAISEDVNAKRQCVVPIRLPPWWELHEQASAKVAFRERETEVQIPRTDRNLLFGESMIRDLGQRVLQIATEGRVPSKELGRKEARNALYQLTKEVHRDWLMTPRDDLDGRRPRDLLHGAHDWIDAVIIGQRQRFEDGAGLVAAPDDVSGYATAPMGREEMIMYFDLCREIINAGWCWCDQELQSVGQLSVDANTRNLERLTQTLIGVRDSWLEESYEGGSPPQFIIDCSRRRVPRGVGVMIEGMSGVESEEHVEDCKCPICDMMSSGMFGVSFSAMDGHHLELDDEFAFSCFEKMDDWKDEQCEYAEMSESIHRKMEADQAKQADGSSSTGSDSEEFGTAWSSPVTEKMLPGDPLGHLKLAFRLAEIVADLESAGADNDTIQNINLAFRSYRESESEAQEASKVTLVEGLENAAQEYPQVLPKVADFQSQVDELHRTTLELSEGDSWDENDLP